MGMLMWLMVVIVAFFKIKNIVLQFKNVTGHFITPTNKRRMVKSVLF